jgi:ribosomal protein S21
MSEITIGPGDSFEVALKRFNRHQCSRMAF